jgi:hypothetical protein
VVPLVSDQAEALMLDRYFTLGQRAAAAVGRIFLQAPDGSGSGLAPGTRPHQLARAPHRRMGPGSHPHHGRRGGCRRFLHLPLFGASGKIVRSEYATIIQHPNGRQKHIASRNNRIEA